MAGIRNDKKPYSRPPARPRASEGAWLHDKASGFKKNEQNASRPGRAVTVSEGNSKLVVSNLHYELTPKDLTYDRSGRSSGVAILFYETADEAATTKREFDGKLARGQPMQIEFDAGPPPRLQARRIASAPSLINRIQKPPLLERLADTPKAPRAPRAAAPVSNGPGPVRTKAPRQPKEKKKPKTMQELDSELEAFMKDDNAVTVQPAAPATAPAPAAGDVEMAT
ncbi:hypothetical protein EIP91_001240 [Steccherinum ochraceum]|uniref:RRM domain-containing protein n=1 Tax=Steccherinum ochraceum TaxID=92696 RepID=A0A4R0RHG3_9APHY|nr:hypothetical protein EIP91_001240 [Steccherinum ochraceum]